MYFFQAGFLQEFGKILLKALVGKDILWNGR